MEPSTQKLIHTFGALADLGQEIAGRGDFNEMVRTSMHLLLGTLALRRGAVVECVDKGELRCLAIWGVREELFKDSSVTEEEKQQFQNGDFSELLLSNSAATNSFINRNRELLDQEGIELVLPMIVREEITGLVLLGKKASGEE